MKNFYFLLSAILLVSLLSACRANDCGCPQANVPVDQELVLKK